ncbi:MAG TPA: phosphate acyltransferase PlsX [Acidimicrobiales bacterium]|nr:phosphate acyltransferase PlsX [Acidimicrobiales bacterium]
MSANPGTILGDSPPAAATMLPVAVDAMGGDRAPEEIVEGARQAAALGIPVLLVGDPDRLGDVGDLPVAPALEVISMHDDPANGVRRKKDSSLVRAAEAVRDGRASAMVSAGNTGATMASALFRMGRLPGVARPAIATPIPQPNGGYTVLIDGGANAECIPAWLVQFAQMGSVYSRLRFGVSDPRVGLLSIGEESSKGNPLVKEAHALLAGGAAGPAVNFIGNVEGRDIMSGGVDVVVTDGFTGNVALKALEGGLKQVIGAIIEIMMSTEETRAASKVLLPALAPLADQFDADTYGGAMLVGVNGVCIISHGSSGPRAIVNALKVARDSVLAGMVDQVKAAVASGR